MSLEDLARRANQLQQFNHFTGDPGFSDDYLKRLGAVRIGDVQAAAKRWLAGPYSEVVTIPTKAEGGPR
jgi:predicted Zn-dependent peptidase